jgi:hypothetical protein
MGICDVRGKIFNFLGDHPIGNFPVASQIKKMFNFIFKKIWPIRTFGHLGPSSIEVLEGQEASKYRRFRNLEI